jgi:threonine/homoserine/homoserine lactone efflux protein
MALALFPSAFNVMLLAGALYVGWLGYGLARTKAGLPLDAPQALRSPGATFGRAALTNLLNPKAYVFMLAVFPQFVRPEQGPIAKQALVLGTIIAATQAGVYGVIAWLAAGVRDWLRANPGGSRAVARAVGSVLIVVAGFTVIGGWRKTPADGTPVVTRPGSTSNALPMRTPLPRR